MMIINILTAVTSVLPKVVEFISGMIEVFNKSTNLDEMTEAEADKAKEEAREAIVTATKAEFHGSASLIPEPIIRIIYEYIVLSKYNGNRNHDKIKRAIAKGYIDGKIPDEVDMAINTYPQLFGYKP